MGILEMNCITEKYITVSFLLLANIANGSELDGANKLPPLPKIIEIVPSETYRDVDVEFMNKTKAAREYTSWVDSQTNTTTKNVSYPNELKAKLIYIDKKLVKIETQDPEVVTYFSDHPVVVYAYLLGRAKMHVIQYYDGPKLTYVQIVNGPGKSSNVWYEYEGSKSQQTAPVDAKTPVRH